MSGIGLLRAETGARSRPLTTPTVTELRFLKGLPMATAIWPGNRARVGQGQRINPGDLGGIDLPGRRRAVPQFPPPACGRRGVVRFGRHRPRGCWTMRPSRSTKNPDPVPDPLPNPSDTSSSTTAGLARSNSSVTRSSSNRGGGPARPVRPLPATSRPMEKPRSTPRASSPTTKPRDRLDCLAASGTPRSSCSSFTGRSRWRGDIHSIADAAPARPGSHTLPCATLMRHLHNIYATFARHLCNTYATLVSAGVGFCGFRHCRGISPRRLG